MANSEFIIKKISTPLLGFGMNGDEFKPIHSILIVDKSLQKNLFKTPVWRRLDLARPIVNDAIKHNRFFVSSEQIKRLARFYGQQSNPAYYSLLSKTWVALPIASRFLVDIVSDTEFDDDRRYGWESLVYCVFSLFQRSAEEQLNTQYQEELYHSDLSRAARMTRNLPTERKESQGFVYLVQNTLTKNVKIGFSSSVKSRLSALQTSHDTPLTLLGTIKGSIQKEKSLHKEFSAHRISEKGEWFYPAPEILALFVKNRKNRNNFFRRSESSNELA